jgi:hypothetical protein
MCNWTCNGITSVCLLSLHVVTLILRILEDKLLPLHKDCQASVLVAAARGVETPFKPVGKCNDIM